MLPLKLKQSTFLSGEIISTLGVCKNLFFIGSNSQHHDYKKGTSAFIHGFRYNCQYLSRYLKDDIKPKLINSRNDLEAIAEVVERNNLLVFADEIYEKLIYDGAEHTSIGSLSGMDERVITSPDGDSMLIPASEKLSAAAAPGWLRL
jgi:hypothetical protein